WFALERSNTRAQSVDAAPGLHSTPVPLQDTGAAFGAEKFIDPSVASTRATLSPASALISSATGPSSSQSQVSTLTNVAPSPSRFGFQPISGSGRVISS